MTPTLVLVGRRASQHARQRETTVKNTQAGLQNNSFDANGL